MRSKDGRVLGDRFELGPRIAEGGMGAVFRAIDRETRRDVAVKLVRDARGDVVSRLAQEGQTLDDIRHPAIVGYIARGTTDDGLPWLAMDWIEGETLASRLARGPLSIDEVIALGRRVGSALGAAHRRGLVHRDIKPSNLILRGSTVEGCVVVDFGIAHQVARVGTTVTGTVLGTPGYMAPEQARGSRGLDARADVFALGCVLFECLTGRAPFVGDHMLAILAKIILEDAPSPRELRPEIPDALAELVVAMLAKEREHRPDDGDAVVRALDAIALGQAVDAPHDARMLTATELRIVSVVLVGGAGGRGEADATMPATPPQVAIAAGVLPEDARIERLVDGSTIVALAGRDNARDLAAQAAQAALVLAKQFPDAPIVVGTGRGVLAGRLPVGEVLDRVAKLVRVERGGRGIRLDELTAGLLDARFAVRVDGDGFILEGEQRTDTIRRVCGVPTTCLGRDRELRLLADLFDEVRDERAARVALVVAPGGVGKTRLRQEVLARLPAPYAQLIGRGDPMRAGSPFALLGHALRWAIGLGDGQPIAEQRRRVAAHVAPYVASAQTALFLGELAGVRADDATDPVVQAARRDPNLMMDLRQRAFVDYLRALTEHQPIVLVLEDLHWGDAGSVAVVDAALRDLADRPLFVLALARPNVRAAFPGLWSHRQVTEIGLAELSKRSAERLVREVLPHASDDLVARVVERAGGNAFYVEELIRAIAAGRAELPDTVLATVQTRLEAIPGELRRVLRAASVFGEVFGRGGVRELVGADVDAALAELVEAELVLRRASPRIAGETEYAFRHGLVREAAYAMLTDADRALGHRLAGAWLERAGESNALVLAEHFELGGDAARAIAAYARAAEQALGGNELRLAIAHAARARSLGATGELDGKLRGFEAETHRWLGELPAARDAATRALDALAPGSAAWFRALGILVMASGRRGEYGDVVAAAQRVASIEPIDRPARSACVEALCEASRMLYQTGRYDLAHELGRRVEALVVSTTFVAGAAGGALEGRASRLRAATLLGVAPAMRRDATTAIDAFAGDAELPPDLEPAAVIELHRLRAARARHTGDVVGDLQGYEAVLAAYERYGDVRSACNARVSVGFARIELGDHAGAEVELRRALADAERLYLESLCTRARQNLALVVAHRGDHAEARALLARVIAESAAHGNQRFEGWSRIYLAQVALAAGDPATAELEAGRAVTTFAESPPPRAGALAMLARARVAVGRAGEAAGPAREALAILERFGGIEEFESLVWLAAIEAASADARPALAARARARLDARAAAIRDEAMRARFLAVDENARIARSESW